MRHKGFGVFCLDFAKAFDSVNYVNDLNTPKFETAQDIICLVSEFALHQFFVQIRGGRPQWGRCQWCTTWLISGAYLCRV